MRFRKKPIVIEAIQWTGGNWSEIDGFTQGWARLCVNNGLVIDTIGGSLHVAPGDWIVRGVVGEFYPCSPDIFDATYEPCGGPGGVIVSEPILGHGVNDGGEFYEVTEGDQGGQGARHLDDPGQGAGSEPPAAPPSVELTSAGERPTLVIAEDDLSVSASDHLELEAKLRETEAALDTMTSERNVWRESHDEACPNLGETIDLRETLAERDAEIERLLKVEKIKLQQQAPQRGVRHGAQKAVCGPGVSSRDQQARSQDRAPTARSGGTMNAVVGRAVTCRVCGLRKKPWGRSAPLAMANSLCDRECPGWLLPPHAGDLWPGETAEEFGYPCAGPDCEAN